VNPRIPAREALAVLRAKRAEGYNNLAFDGGEPTLRKDLPFLAAEALSMGFDLVNILTNAVALADGKMIKQFLAIPDVQRRLGFCVSLHSHLPRVSDAITRAPGTFAKTIDGLRAIRAAGFSFALYHVVTSLNFRALPRYADFAAKKFPEALSVTFSHIFPPEFADKDLLLYPRVTAAAPYLVKACDRLKAAGIRPDLSSCGVVPLCLMRGSEKLFLETSKQAGKEFLTYDTKQTGSLQVFGREFNARYRAKGRRCASCFIDRACMGMWEFYLAKFGQAELRPFSAAYFRRLARNGGTAELDLAGCLGSPDPPALARIALMDLRYRGFSRLKLKSGTILPGETVKLRAFARAAGFVLVC
jgi:cyclic pyranopterin phosphate synthase